MPRLGYKILLVCGFSGMLTGLLNGCNTTRHVDRDVVTTELPVYLGQRKIDHIRLSALFLVGVDGDVEEVHLANSSGDPGWDKAAVDSMMNWRFPPPPIGREVWQKRTIIVEIIQTEKINLGKISAGSLQDAEILYSRLRGGISFESLVRESQDEESLVKEGRYLRNVDTSDMPLEISRQLIALKPGQFTRPIEMHGGYYIFKRYGEYVPR
jgi:TonB family protein